MRKLEKYLVNNSSVTNVSFLLISLLLATLFSCSDRDEANVSKIPCKEIVVKWEQFVKNNRKCRDDEDCTLIHPGDCRCSGMPNPWISKLSFSEATKYVERYFSKECESHFPTRRCGSIDMGISSTQCINGLCEPVMSSCRNPTTDGGN